MSLTSIDTIMTSAREGRYAVGYFESWNLDSLQGTIDAAEESRSPMIIGFNGDFLSGRERIARERLSWYGALGKAAAESTTVPCGLLFNECPNDDWVRAAVGAGFNLVMPADPSASLENATRRVSQLTQYAHSRAVAVEAEIGELPLGTAAGPGHAGSLTDPDQAAWFVDATGVDLLAVSVGNIHVRLEGRGGLDLDRLERIAGKVKCGLVLHGGTGIAPEALQTAIGLGVVKVNYGTYLKQSYLAAVRKALANAAAGPHRLFGIGGPDDAMTAGRLAVRDAVLARIDWLGCAGKSVR